MKIVVYPHDLAVGGSQLNAIELAAAVRDLGHEVVVFGRPGALLSRVEALGLEFVESPPLGRRPSPRVVRSLRALAQERGVDLVHAYEWPPALEAWLACRSLERTTTVVTVMSMGVAPFIPLHLPLVVGTEQIASLERAVGRADVTVIEPPVDLQHNTRQHLPDAGRFLADLGLQPGAPTVVCVSRFARQLKLEGLLCAVQEVPRSVEGAQLLVVGGGPARPELETAQARANAAAGRRAVVLAGELDDPRPAYAAATVCLGMGGSALRAMAFGVPLVVQGEVGFWRALTPETLPYFLWNGFYGRGDRVEDGPQRLTEALLPLLEQPALRAERAAFGAQVVRDRFGLARAAERQLEVYERAVRRDPAAVETRAERNRTVRTLAHHVVARKVDRLRGTRTADDFNSAPVVQDVPVAAGAHA